ncbi:DUF6891 domain-containing protein [Litorimonas sp. WD9-15]|uniref:DUF6891 domain-containing protein n=1 Tax=Litorimonas sp. WD9-15 TaxID=3418716 RepID=UPI003D000761
MIFLTTPEWVKSIPSFIFTALFLVLAFFLSALFQNFKYRFSLKNKSAQISDEEVSYVKERARQVVRLGKDTYEIMWDSIEDAALDSGVNRVLAKSILDTEISNLKSEQVNWPPVTDNDHLEAAFTELKKMGYHTGTGIVEDPSYEISLARKAAKSTKLHGLSILGYVFFTCENAEDAMSGSPIEFWYGSVRKRSSAAENIKIANDLNFVLQEQGLRTNWDGSEKSQITLNIDWKVRWDEVRMVSN